MTTDVGLTHRTLSKLVEWESPLFVSAFVPVDFSRPQPTEPITQALRRLAQLATATLTEQYRLAPGAAAMFVAPLLDESILDDVPSSARGLAVFVAADESTHLPLPIEVGPAVEVGHQPDVLRLLPAIVDDVEYYALTIGKKGARLFRGGQFEFEPILVPNMPGSIDDALWYIRREPVRERVGSGVMHGAGGGEDMRKDDVRQYIHLIDKAITPVLTGEEAPLVVIGVEYEASMFLNHTHYRTALDVPVLGSPDSMPADELHHRSWDAVHSRSHAAAAAANRLSELAGTGRTVVDTDELLTASRDGLVSTLLVARAIAHDGGPETAPVAERRPAIVKSVNECLRHRAQVFLVDDDALPAGATAAAILRY